MAELVDEYDPEIRRNWPEFERLAISIVSRQLSTASAIAVRERVFEVLGGEVTPATVLAADEEALRSAGLSGTKIEYVRNAARAFRENDSTREGLAGYSDEEVIDLLTEIKGVGEWTAQMYLI